MKDVLVVGGGIIGLSIARELAKASLKVALFDRQEPGREASWAGAGIFPPGVPGPFDSPANQLARETHALWPSLTAELREETGIDNGFRPCGGFMLDRSLSSIPERTFRPRPVEPITDELRAWQSCGAIVEPLSPGELHRLEPALTVEKAVGFRLPEVCQVRNPRHLQALLVSCERHGVELHPHEPVERLHRTGSRCDGIETHQGVIRAGAVVVAAGAWSEALLQSVQVPLSIQPVRGQMALLTLPRPAFRHVIECGIRYLVPRDDGRVLVGATEERAGFDKQPDPQEIDKLVEFARTLVPALRDARLETSWAGLRPCPMGDVPFIGPAPDCPGLHVATGHFRAGLHLSPLTARRIRDGLVASNPSRA